MGQDRMNSLHAKCFLVLAVTVLAGWSPAHAQSSAHDSGTVDIRVGGLASIQPKGYDGTGGPYLTNSLGGTVPGINASVNVSSAKLATLAVELSTTTNLKALQSGRFVIGLGPVQATHRDTLLSVLPGIRLHVQRASVEAKAGISLLFGTPHRESFDFDDPAGTLAFTVGGDVIVPVGDHVALVPTVRYSFARRGDNAFYFGLGNRILRLGVAVRFPLASL